jgi:hypothetical protein
MSNHFNERRIGAAACGDVEFVANETDLVGGFALVIAIGPSADEGEGVGTAGAFRNYVEGLRGSDVAGNVGAFLFKVEIGTADGAVGQRVTDDPVAAEVGGGEGEDRDE